MEINESFPEEDLYFFNRGGKVEAPSFVDFANYLIGWVIPKYIASHHKKKFFVDANNYIWEDPNLFRVCADQVIRKYISHKEGWDILRQCHAGSLGGHYSAKKISLKVLEVGM